MAEEPVEQKTVVRQTNGATEIGIAGKGTDQVTKVVAYPAWQLVLVRSARSGLQSFMGALSIGATGFPEYLLSIPYVDLGIKLKLAVSLGLGAACWSILQDTFEFLKNFDLTHPLWRA